MQRESTCLNIRSSKAGSRTLKEATSVAAMQSTMHGATLTRQHDKNQVSNLECSKQASQQTNNAGSNINIAEC